ncbi:MAG: urease accessory protein UreD [Rhodobiaceae bacterium]|nr:urease accessory protein UreD [Rhodobiaceae bacterium]
MQRAQGHSRIAFRTESGQTRLANLFQEGACKIRLPKTEAGAPPLAVLINSAGGLTGGDRLSVEAQVGEGGHAVITSQACERVYRSAGGAAHFDASIKVGPGARLDWLPQETILFDHARLARRLTADLAGNARLLAVESVIFGRTSMGESVTQGSFCDRWRIRRDGRLLFADDVRFNGPIAELLGHASVLAGGCAMATVLYAGEDAEEHAGGLRAALGEAGAASAWEGKLVARIAAADGQALRAVLVKALGLLSGTPLPRMWHC